MTQKPIVLSMLLCDRVEDRDDGRLDIFGTVLALTASVFPARIDELCLYLEFIDTEATFELGIRVVDLADDSVIAHDAQPVTTRDRLRVNYVTMNLSGLILPHPGVYVIQILFEGEVERERRFTIEEVTDAEVDDSNEGADAPGA